jgi:nucleotide-binding universal stress UspA family protein
VCHPLSKTTPLARKPGWTDRAKPNANLQEAGRMIKRILVGLAGTPYRSAALYHAIELAKAHGAELTGVTVVDVQRLSSIGPAPIGAEVTGIELRDHRLAVTSEHVREEVEAFQKACAAENVPHRVRCEQGDAFRRMHCCARYHDLTVFGLRSIFEYYFEKEESTALLGRLVGGGVRPILAVASEPRPIRRVLVAYNGSMASAKSLRHFVQLRPWPDTPLRIVTFDGVEEDPKDLLANAADYCRAHGIEPEVEHVPGPAMDRLLPHAAEWEADLIVMGNSRRRFILKQLFGETTLHLMQTADRPLFLSQ